MLQTVKGILASTLHAANTYRQKVPACDERSCVTFLGHVAKQRKKCSVPHMAIFTKYGIKLIPNGHWEQPLRMEFLQWIFQPHSGRKYILRLYIRALFISFKPPNTYMCPSGHTCSVMLLEIKGDISSIF